MQILGIYLEYAPVEIRKSLHNNTWYGFQGYSNVHDIFKNKNECNELIKQLKDKQTFEKDFYEYHGKQISINSIVGRNGSGKSSLLDIYHIIINNFAARIKDKFPNYNKDYEISKTTDVNAELFYENNHLIYAIKVKDGNVTFSNNKTPDLFTEIKKVADFADHCFYTISNNYSLYSEYPEWKRNLYHKNDGYFTPIVLVPFREDGNIDIVKENKLAEKRIQILSLLLYKDEHKDFIENYIPYKFDYNLRKLKKYKEYIDEKIKKLEKDIEFGEIYVKSNTEREVDINTPRFHDLKDTIKTYWGNFFSTKNNALLNDYVREYAIYKTLKSCVNYEIIRNQLDFSNLQKSIKNIIENELWNEKHINYINLKLLTCKRFLEYSFCNIYNSSDKGSIKIKDLLDNSEIKNAASYDQLYLLSLPDFFEIEFFYSRKQDENGSADKTNIAKDGESAMMQLFQMSSGEQQLYNTLSYVVYHIKNAQSNKNSNENGRIPYKNFNIIFDEAELYYHPEYQRCFIRNLIMLINRSNLSVDGMNITVVTHSPFILSDISSENILALENGIRKKRISKTLGANIYDLLQNQFFMKSSIGECSKKIIEKIIESCDSDRNLSEEEIHFYEAVIENLGDDYLSSSLRGKLDSKNKSYDSEIAFYRKKIEELEALKKKKEADE